MGTLSGKGGEVSVATMVIPEKQQGCDELCLTDEGFI